MADIDEVVKDIRKAQLGLDIIETMAVGIETINGEVESTTSRQRVIEGTIAGAIELGGNPSLEVGEARKGETSLGAKIDKIDENIQNNVMTLANMSSQLQDISINALFPALGFAPIKADGITDDILPLQAMSDFCYEHGYKLKLPKGTILISKPWVVYGSSDEYAITDTFITGAGREVTNIIKNTNTTLGSGEYANIDAIIIIANEYIKNNVAITSIWSSQSIANKIHMDNFSLKSTSTTRIAYGIYSYGIFISKFFNIGFHFMGTAFKTTRYDCYNTFERLEINQTAIGFDIWSDSGAATTLRFMDVHLNGVTQFGYKIKGHATFINCSNDGGSLMVYYFLSSRITLLNCHSESPACLGVMYADGNPVWGPSTITIINCGIMTPLSTTTPTFQAISYTFIHAIDLKINTNQIAGLPVVPAGRLYSAGANCSVTFDNLKILNGDYANYVPYSISDSEKHILVDRNHLNIANHTYMPYVSSAIAVANRNTATVTVDNTNKTIILAESGSGTSTPDATSGYAGFGTQAVFFDVPLNFDNYSRVYVKATIDFEYTNASYNSVSVNIRSQVYTGVNLTAVPTIAVSTSIKNDTINQEFFIDVSNLFGNYYVDLSMYNTGTLTIKEISLLK